MRTVLIVACTLLIAPTAHAVVINIDATVNGANPDNPVSIFLEAGTYSATLLNPSINASALFTAWSADSDPTTWRTNSAVRLQDGSLPPVSGDCTNCGPTPLDAFASTPVKTMQFVVPTDQTVGFVITDTILSDNSGGISLEVLAVPEPARSLLAAGPSLAVLGFAFARSRRHRAGPADMDRDGAEAAA